MNSITKSHLKSLALKILPLVFVGFSLLFFYQSLVDVRLADLSISLTTTSSYKIVAAIVLMILSFSLLAASEVLAFRFIENTRIPLKEILKISFIAFGISNAIPIAGIAASSIRLRLYSFYKISTDQILKVIAFCSAGVWLGFLLLAGITNLSADIDIFHSLPVQPYFFRFFGLGSLVLVGAYIFICHRQIAVKFNKFEIRPPKIKIAIIQIAIATIDWILAAGVLYVLLPASVAPSFQVFFLIFLVSQILGLVIHIPGGLGILEFLFVTVLLSGKPLNSDLVASFLLYRFIYYIIPLSASILFLTKFEIANSKSLVLLAFKQIKGLIFSYAPNVASIAVFFSGMMLLISGATPEVPTRMNILAGAISARLISSSHFFASLIGVCLLILANALRKRSASAWFMTLGLTGIAIVLSILKGIDYEEASILSLFCLGLLLTKDEFFRKSSLFDDSLSTSWLLAVGAVVFSISSFTYLKYVGILDKSFVGLGIYTDSDMSRTLQASIGAMTLSLLFGFWKLLSPQNKAKTPRRIVMIAEVESHITQSTETLALLAYTGDKKIFLSKGVRSFIMQANQGRSWISMGNPIGLRDSFKSAINDFMRASDQHDCWPVFYQVNDHYLSTYVDLGFRVIKIGEEGRINLTQFSLEGRERKSMRNTCSRIEKDGYEFSIVSKSDFHLIFDELKRISDVWLAKNEMKEKGFSVGFFDKDYLSHFDTAVLKKNGEILAFANIWQSAGQEELSVDLMRSNLNAPSGAMEYIFIQLILFGKNKGYKWFNLGMAPLAGLDESSNARSWQSLANFAFEFGEYFYNFRGVKAFKDKFSPEWESRYLAFPQNTSLTAVMTDLIRLISKKGQNLISHIEERPEIKNQEPEEQNDKKAA